ncbi:MAG: hypothetical protein GY816_20630, partial [Cytophagales bacterium]|nr:hypothetical protein [Cytophagales bacterium]
LDINFKEDASRKRKGNSARNFSIMTKIALMLIEKMKTKYRAIKKYNGLHLMPILEKNYSEFKCDCPGVRIG